MGDHNYSVSVVIPCYRCANTIRRAVDSVVNQSFRPLEIILVDDASGDTTSNQLELIAQEFPPEFIRVIISPSNQGPGSSRNRGWDLAKGSLVAFLDSDDIWTPNKLAIQLAAIHRQPDAVLTGHFTAVMNGTPTQASEDASGAPLEVGIRALLFRNAFATRTVIVRRDLPLRFKEGMRFSEDYLLWLEIVASGHRAFVVPSVLAYSFKQDFGAGGLSAQLWRMEKGEIRALLNSRHFGRTSRMLIAFACLWSLAKFFRRCLISKFRRVAAHDNTL